jgi:tRNA pseudouridine65 synthase
MIRESDPPLEIIYRDNRLIAINKPPGLLVHRTRLAADAKFFALQILRNQIDQRVFPVHRLDRKTSGVLLFALDEEMHRMVQFAFAERKIEKKYFAIVRGFTAEKGTIDYPLKKENGTFQEAITQYETLAKTEIEIPSGKHNTSRYSIVEISPLTGRKHQIRRHLAHLRHPIIADRPYGCNKQNKLFSDHFGLTNMMLHAHKLTFHHPETEETVCISAKIHEEFTRMISELRFPLPGALTS